MPTYTPAVFPLDGTEAIPVLAAGRGGMLTLAQLRAWAQGQPIGPGMPNPPVGQPAVTALDGTEQFQIGQGPGWMIATTRQLAAWIMGNAIPPFERSASGAGFGGYAAVATLDGSEAVYVRQGPATRAMKLATLRDWTALG